MTLAQTLVTPQKVILPLVSLQWGPLVAGLSCFYRTWLIWRTTMPYRRQAGVRATPKRTNEQSTLFFLFLRTLLLDTGRLLLPGWELASRPFAHPRPSETGRTTAGPLPSGGCDQHRFLVDCSSPASLPLVRPTPSRRRLRRPQRHPPYQAQPACHIGWPSQCCAALCSSKGSDGRSEATNATLLQLSAIARLISCRVAPCHLVAASRTAGRGRSGAVIRVSSRSIIQNSALRGLWTGAQVAIGDFSGHGLWGHHISSQTHPPPLPGSPLAFPRASAAQSKQAYLAPRPVRVSLRSTENQGRIPSVNNTGSAVGHPPLAFAALRIQEGPETETTPAVTH